MLQHNNLRDSLFEVGYRAAEETLYLMDIELLIENGVETWNENKQPTK